MNLKHAVNEAIDECIHQDIMADFLRRNRAEVVKMSIYEYDEEKNYKMLQEQYWNMGHERGKSEGIAQGRAEGMARGRRKNQGIYSIDSCKNAKKLHTGTNRGYSGNGSKFRKRNLSDCTSDVTEL